MFSRTISSFIKFTLLFFFAFAANAATSLPWVFDEPMVVSAKVVEGMNHVLAQAASNRNIHLRVIVVQIPYENANELIHHKMIEYKNKIPYQFQEKTSFLIINLALNQSHIYLGEDVRKSENMAKSLIHIQKEIIQPALIQKEFGTALTQGAIAITTVIDTNPAYAHKATLWQSFVLWISTYYLLSPFQILFWLSLLFVAWWGIINYLNRSPPLEVQEVDMIALQEQMIRNSIMLRQRHRDSFFDGTS